MYATIAILACCAATPGLADITNLVLASDYDDVVNNRQDGDDLSAYDLVPGDYPTYKEIPRTSFSCRGKVHWHYYADVETGCQTFHVCETDYSKISFLCPIGSVFNQLHLVCDWWYNVDCSESLDLYPLREGVSDNFLRTTNNPGFLDVDLNLASSGGNSDPKENNKKSNESGSSRESRRKKP